jgi:hypothetical protein
MKGLMIPALAALALLTAAAGLFRSHSFSTNDPAGTVGMARATSQEAQVALGTSKLPVDDFEDRSLVFPRETKH